MTDKAKLIDLIKSGNLNLAIELSKGLGLNINELLICAIDSTEKDDCGVRVIFNYRIRYPGCNDHTLKYWFCVDSKTIIYSSRGCKYTYTNFETPELLAEAILNLHNSLNND